MTNQATFDAEQLEMLRSREEVGIRTGPASQRPVTIWIVVVNDVVFVRSVRGPRGKWYLAARAAGEATLVVGQQEFPVRATAVTDPATLDAVSQAFLSKYATSPYAASIVSADAVPTTLRLDRR
ncbi:MAG TPA: DUF2255 family protein [Acetobacteraceae bacterium]|nr:DUF2255 family protein [Acetobacteraceae bacterium]